MSRWRVQHIRGGVCIHAWLHLAETVLKRQTWSADYRHVSRDVSLIACLFVGVWSQPRMHSHNRPGPDPHTVPPTGVLSRTSSVAFCCLDAAQCEAASQACLLGGHRVLHVIVVGLHACAGQ